jgi:hypothetical protein
MEKVISENAVLYDQDFYAWGLRTAELIQAGRFNEVDLEILADEISSMSRSDYREVSSRAAKILQHLLKWKYQPEKRTRSWTSTIVEQRIQIKSVLDESPSLRRKLLENLDKAYADAVEMAVSETGLPKTTFPETCPFTLEQVLDSDFLP